MSRSGSSVECTRRDHVNTLATYVLKKAPQTCSLRPSDAEAMERLRIASSLSYRLASPTKGESRAPHAQYTARAQVAMLAPRETGRAAARAG